MQILHWRVLEDFMHLILSPCQIISVFIISLIFSFTLLGHYVYFRLGPNYKVKMARFNQIKETACIMTEAGQRVVQAI